MINHMPTLTEYSTFLLDQGLNHDMGKDISNILLCHHCRKNSDLNKLIKCKSPSCKLFYCQNCLTKKYKYSKSAARKLTHKTWICPRCNGNCHCELY